MNTKEVGEIRRHLRRDRSNITKIYGCYVNDNKEVISEFQASTGIMPENEAEKYFALFKRLLSGKLGKTLLDIGFSTKQVSGSPEHMLLMDLRKTALDNEEKRKELYQKIIDSVSLGTNYLILLGCDTYDVPFKSKDDLEQPGAGEESYTFLVCAICPVKQTKANLHYIHDEATFHDGGMMQAVSAPSLGFLFPAFDGRATNIYNALFYTSSPKESFQEFIEAVFNTATPQPAESQKTAFNDLIAASLGEECSVEIMQALYDNACEQVALHRECKIADTLVADESQIESVLSACGISEEKKDAFKKNFNNAFGANAELPVENIIDTKRFEVHTPDVVIKISPDRTDLLEMRRIGGVDYIMIPAGEEVEVNGVKVTIKEEPQREPN